MSSKHLLIAVNVGEQMENLRILELFSGIGGMHYAFKCSGLPGEIAAAVDINTVANTVYSHNYPQTKVMNNNIQKFSAELIDGMRPNTILMSPPCQPFTRVGMKLDMADSRTDALKHLCGIIGKLSTVKRILMENVKGFEKSRSRDMYVECLIAAGYDVREFILSPSQIGVPNTRHRYYCIARRDRPFAFPQVDPILDDLPEATRKSSVKAQVKEFLDPGDEALDSYLIPDKILAKRAWLLDIVSPEDINTMCFTKAYTHYCEGTGSVVTLKSKKEIGSIFEAAKSLDQQSPAYVLLLKSLRLRYFTPQEVSRLMSFPTGFTFPDETTKRQRYRLLGNSINVLVVSELIKLLCS